MMIVVGNALFGAGSGTIFMLVQAFTVFLALIAAEWGNAKIAIFALLGATAGEAVVWYGGQFYALFFLTQTIKVPA